MTRAMFRFVDGDALEMRVLGHANFRQMGNDPVCAGASVLAFTAAQCIEAMGDKLQKAAHINIGGGNVRVVAKPKPEYRAEALHTFYVAQVGFQLLSEAYPENVELTPFNTHPEWD